MKIISIVQALPFVLTAAMVNADTLRGNINGKNKAPQIYFYPQDFPVSSRSHSNRGYKNEK
jgi:hypothetical protein